MIDKVINVQLLHPVNIMLILVIVAIGGLGLSLLFPPASAE